MSSENFEAPESAEELDHILLSPAHHWDSQIEQTPEIAPFHEYYGLDLPPPAPKRLKIIFPGRPPSSRESASTPRGPAAIGTSEPSDQTIIKSEQSHHDTFATPNAPEASGAMSQFQYQYFDTFSTTETSSSTAPSTTSTPANFDMSAWVLTTRSGRANRPPGRIQEAVSDQEVLLETRDHRAKVLYKAPMVRHITKIPRARFR